MIRSALFYWVECDRCGRKVESDYAAWAEKDYALDEAYDSEWMIGGAGEVPDDFGQVCWKCVELFTCRECGSWRPEDSSCLECGEAKAPQGVPQTVDSPGTSPTQATDGQRPQPPMKGKTR